MHAWQRFLIGPLVALATAVAIVILKRSGLPVAFPTVIGFLPIVLALYVSGIGSAAVATAVALANTVTLLPATGGLVLAYPDSLSRAALLLLTTAIVGSVVNRERRTNACMQIAHQAIAAASVELIALRAALDQVDYGVVLLDEGLHAQFVNKAYRQTFDLPNGIAEAKPAFAQLMQNARDKGAYAMMPTQVDAYIASRIELVRRGDREPLDLHLAEGKVLRFQCSVLPDGGRMLSYSDITDLYGYSRTLERLVSTDSLTGLYNRRGFFEVAHKELNRFDRYTRPLSLLMLDIDLFKSINDRFGHDVGDQVIIDVSDVLRRSMRDSHVAARIGGEEFAVLLPETDLASACVIAERLRSQIAANRMELASGSFAVTVSIGVAEATHNTEHPAALMKLADEALYEAKSRGRNCVAVLESDALAQLSGRMRALAEPFEESASHARYHAAG